MTAGSIMERVIVKLDMVSKGFQNSMNRANMATKGFRKGLADAGHALNMPIQNMKIMDRQGFLMKTSLGRAAMGVRHMTHGLRGFRMEMLGTMFFGMMLQQMFLGFLRPVMEAFGVFDMFRLMLLVLFLPTMEMLFEPMLKIMTWFMELPEESQKAIGVFTLLGIVIGTLLFTIGTFALGIGSVIQILPDFSKGLGKLGRAIKGLRAIFSISGLLITAVLVGIFIAWKENFMNIREYIGKIWEGIKDIFSGAMKAIEGFIEMFMGLMEGDFEKFEAGLKKLLSGLAQFFKGIKGVLINLFITIVIGAWRALWGIVQILFEVGRRIGRLLAELIKSAYEKLKDMGKSMMEGLADGIRNAWHLVFRQVNRLIQAIKDMFGFDLNFILDLMGGDKNKKDDFIWRPGSGAVSINPNDTVVGYKGETPFGATGETTINNTNNFYGYSKDELDKDLDDRDRRMVDEVRRLVKE